MASGLGSILGILERGLGSIGVLGVHARYPSKRHAEPLQAQRTVLGAIEAAKMAPISAKMAARGPAGERAVRSVRQQGSRRVPEEVEHPGEPLGQALVSNLQHHEAVALACAVEHREDRDPLVEQP